MKYKFYLHVTTIINIFTDAQSVCLDTPAIKNINIDTG